VTCREDDYESLGMKLRLGAAVRVEPLGDGQVSRLLSDLGADTALDAMREDAQMREHFRSPLMLSVLASSGADLLTSPGGPAWSELYRRYVDRALAKGASHRYTPERTVEGLAWLARAMNRQGTTDLWLEHLGPTWLSDPWERHLARALGFGAIVGGAFGAMLAAQLWVGLELSASLIASLISTGVLVLVLRRTTVRPVEALGWSWRRALDWTPVTLAFAALATILFAGRIYVVGPNSGMSEADVVPLLVANIVLTGPMALCSAAVLGLVPGDRETRVRPNQGIRQSLLNGLLVALPTSLVIAPLLAYVALPHLAGRFVELRGALRDSGALTVRIAVAFGSPMLLGYGGAAAMMHAVVRAMLALRTPLPLRLVTFLDHAVASGLLRRVGGGYLFLHRTLLDHFAASANPASPPAGSSARPSGQGRSRRGSP
jgi:hypothetical protein